MKTLLYALVAALVIVLIVSGGALLRTLGEKPSAPPAVNKAAPVAAARPGVTTLPAGPVTAAASSVRSGADDASSVVGSPLAANLNAPKGTPQQDVDTLHELVLQYQHNMRHPNALPIGDDSDLVRALTGHNPLGFVVIPPNHSAISSDGRLLDRWGTPYFVHPMSASAIDIRSAGPDKKMFTSDDLIASP